MKPLTFEEWESLPGKPTPRYAWEAARVGMIPEDEAVRIPPASDWPNHADYVALFWYNEYVGIDECETAIKLIPRPKPVWTPKVGDEVFYLTNDNTLGIGVIERVSNDDRYYYYMTGYPNHGWAHVKPFHADHIGKPWDQIPGGFE